MAERDLYENIPVVSVSRTGGLTSIRQLIDTTSNEAFSFGFRNTSSDTAKTLITLRPMPHQEKKETKEDQDR